MADNMSYRNLALILIVAATTKNGIGKDGALPWPMLKREMQYFARVTKRLPPPSNTASPQSHGPLQNAVIMGRKTWDSIPPKFRPLKDRTNVIISTQSRAQLGPLPQDVVLASDIPSALVELTKLVEAGQALPLGRAFIIGGSSIYKQALELPQTKFTLLTRIHKDYECDTFFPDHVAGSSAAKSGWERQELPAVREFTGEDMPDGLISEQTKDGMVEFEYQLYARE